MASILDPTATPLLSDRHEPTRSGELLSSLRTSKSYQFLPASFEDVQNVLLDRPCWSFPKCTNGTERGESGKTRSATYIFIHFQCGITKLMIHQHCGTIATVTIYFDRSSTLVTVLPPVPFAAPIRPTIKTTNTTT